MRVRARRPGLTLLAAAGVLAFAIPVARAQMDSREGIALQNQILQLRRDLQDLQTQVASGAVAAPRPRNDPAPVRSGDMVANLLDRVSQLEEQVRGMQGRADENSNRLQRSNEDLSKQVADLNYRMQALENGGRAPGASSPGNYQAPPGSGLGTAPEGPPPRTPELVLQQGNAALGRRDYASAETAAREVLAGRSPRAYDAQFLLAQALVGKRDFQQAALAYDDAYNRGRTGPHAQDALLGMASSLASLNETRAACATLVKLRAEYPQPRGDVRDGAGALRQRLGCP